MGAIPRLAIPLLAMLLASQCTTGPPSFREQRLPSGNTVKILEFHLGFGNEHGQREPANDGFTLYYVSNALASDPRAQELEAWEVFELIRPAAELWGFYSASLTSRPTLEWRGEMVLYSYIRSPSGDWSVTRAGFP